MAHERKSAPVRPAVEDNVRRHEIVKLLDFLDEVTRWAQGREDVVALALVGSYARDAARPDSDVDLTVLCENASLLIDNQDWTALFGNARKIMTENYGPTCSLRVFYDHGWEVEFGVADPSWARIPLDAGTRRVISDGIRILYDPLGVLATAKDAAS